MHIVHILINSLVVFCFLIIQTVSYAATFDETNNQQWFQYYNQTKVKDNFSILSDVGIRYKDNLTRKSQFLIRTAVRYSINKNITCSFGVGNFNYYSFEHINRIEFRPYQELSINNVFTKIELNHRIRTEQQIFNNSEIEFQEYSNRIRYKLLGTFSIINFNQSRNKLDLFLGGELFLIGKNNLSSVQNRLLLGASLKFIKNLSVSIIYNRQNVSQLKSGNNKIDHIAWVSISHNLDFTKSNKIEN